MEKFMKHGGVRAATIALVALFVVLVALCFLLFNEYRSLRQLQIADSRQFWASALQRRAPLTISDVESIQSWMTFDYLDKVFNMPPEYLKTALNLSDPRYPRISLSRYARYHGMDAVAFTTGVKNAVRDYVANKK